MGWERTDLRTSIINALKRFSLNFSIWVFLEPGTTIDGHQRLEFVYLKYESLFGKDWAMRVNRASNQMKDGLCSQRQTFLHFRI